MARAETTDDEYNTGKTARALRTIGHNTSGGAHGPSTPGGRAIQRAISKGNYTILDDGEDDGMAYQYNEFPKFVTLEDGKQVRANDEHEEAKILAGQKVVREPEERKRLLKVAEVKGVQVDGRWSLEKISKAIVDAGHDANLDPFK